MKQENKHIAMAAAQEKIARLRQGFLRRIPDMLAQAERLLVQLVAEPSEACRKQLHILLHSIHGSAGSFGFSPLANASAEGERLLTEPETEQSTLHYDELRRIIRWLYTLTQEQLNLEHRISDTEFTLPIAAQRPEEGYVRRASKPIYLCDDDIDQVELLATQLRCFGFTCHVFANTQDFTQAVLSQPPAVVIMDVSFPEFSGEELTKLIRQIPQHIGLPIAYLSSETNKHAQLGAMSIGAEDFILKQSDPEELIRAVSIRAERMRVLRARMSQDSLSGLYNHSTTTHFLKSAIAESNYSGNPFCMVMVDLDRFKSINDTYGHAVGDQVIVGISQLFSHRLRSTDIVGRYGGEEFVIIMPNTSSDKAARVVERLRRDYEQVTFSVNDASFHSTFSAGIAQWQFGDRIETLRERADQALYAAKQNGRNTFCIAE